MSSAPTPPAVQRRVLEDASGRRLRFLRRVGRAVALLLILWLCAVFLGGIGVGPATHIPFGHLLRPTLAPPPLRHAPRVTPPAPADLVPAVPATAAPAVVTTTRHTARTTTKGKSASAPGRRTATTTTRGKSAAAPGHARTTTVTHTNPRSKRPTAPPGRTKTTTNRGRKP